MYYDVVRKAYIDSDSGKVVFQEDAGDEEEGNNTFEMVNEMNIRHGNARTVVNNTSSSSSNMDRLSAFSPTIARPASYSKVSPNTTAALSPYDGSRGSSSQLEQDLIQIHMHGIEMNDAGTSAIHGDNDGGTGTGVGQNDEHGFWDDWSFARTLQAMEFEISNEMMQGAQDREEGDFNEKEYRASRSCRRQLMTLSAFVVLVQIGLLVAMIQQGGYAKQRDNPVIGPSVETMVLFGAKEAGLIVLKDEWWRLLSSVMLHGGIFHIIPNGAIQLRIGGYLNIIYGTWKWFFIYFMSGIFGAMMSCCFLPNSVGVGSSGAVMGMLSSWVVWIIFRWEKIPSECKGQRNCQLFIVVTAIVVTLATSFTPNTDWAAHFGGGLQGALWGIVLLSSELDNEGNQLWLRITAGSVALFLFGFSLYYMVELLHPSDKNFDHWEANDDFR
mmetsp:Transcript_5243/g.8493  ORF Transcript_5243/g.8493 Transcript_5243/m.8493 type:complete len:441 (+) Transcript_5243:39-1361(+)